MLIPRVDRFRFFKIMHLKDRNGGMKKSLHLPGREPSINLVPTASGILTAARLHRLADVSVVVE